MGKKVRNPALAFIFLIRRRGKKEGDNEACLVGPSSFWSEVGDEAKEKYGSREKESRGGVGAKLLSTAERGGVQFNSIHFPN